MKNILFVDGRNFISKINSVLNPHSSEDNEVDFSRYNFAGLFDKVLAGVEVHRRIFYLGRLSRHPDTAKKSEKLIEKQRLLKKHLQDQGFEVVLAGRVRGHLERCSKGHETLTFKEKGVDVQIAVDMITLACREELNLAIIGSSDSDLQPAITALKARGIGRIYLGFEMVPNKGMTFTTDRTILIRNSEVTEFLDRTLL